MNNTVTRIQLIGDYKGYLDIKEDSSFPLNFNVADIRNVTKKTGSFSKSITLADTKNNHRVLKYVYDVNVRTRTIGINTLQYCNVVRNGVVILEKMLLQLISIDTVENNNAYQQGITYQALVKDVVTDFFTAIDTKLLTDINVDDMNHIYTAANVIDSFDSTINIGFTDPADGTIKKGFKYIMPYNPGYTDDPQSDTKFNLSEFLPGIYAKVYFDRIFSGASYSYVWDSMFDDDVQFDKLIIPYNGDIIRTDKEESEQYHATVERIQTNVITAYPIYSMSFNHPFWPVAPNGYRSEIGNSLQPELVQIPIVIDDPNDNYNATFSTYFTPDLPSANMDVNYKFTVEYEVYVDNQSGFPTWFCGARYSPLNGWETPPFDVDVTPVVYMTAAAQTYYTNSLLPGASITMQDGDFFPTGETILASGTASIDNTFFGLLNTQPLQIYTQLLVNTKFAAYSFFNTPQGYLDTISFNNHSLGADLRMRIKNIHLDIQTIADADYGFNVPIKMKKLIPKEIKQGDFIKSIFTMFNLYCDVDKENSNRLRIFKRDEYYDAGEIKDWTKKLIKDKNNTRQFLPELLKRKLLLTYKEDEDYANKVYKDEWNQIYGQLEFTFQDEYAKERDVKDVIFSPTPMHNLAIGAVCPIWNGQAPNTNIRILIDGGQFDLPNSYKIFNSETNIATASVYPHISHWNHPTNPTYDINFGTLKKAFRTDQFVDTNNNLFNLHWTRTLNQINNGDLLTTYFNLDELDIQNLKLNHKIRIDNSYWNINKIIDYDANSNSPTKVELISIDPGLKIPFIPNNPALRMSKNDNSLKFLSQVTKDINQTKNTNLSPFDITLQGQGNYVAENVQYTTIVGSDNIISSNSVVYGSSNSVSQNSVVFGSNNDVKNSSFIYGSGNTIAGSVSNSVIFGNNIVATQSGTFYTNNIYISDGGTINGVTVSSITKPTLQTVLYNGGTASTPDDNFQIFISVTQSVSPFVLIRNFDTDLTNYTTNFRVDDAGISIISGDFVSTGLYNMFSSTGGKLTITQFSGSNFTDISIVEPTTTSYIQIPAPTTTGTYSLGLSVNGIPFDSTGNVVVSGGVGPTGATGSQGNAGPTGATGFGFTASGFEKITESGKTGWRLIGAVAANYGDIGSNAVDASVSLSSSSTKGATGTQSFTANNSTAAGTLAFAANTGRASGVQSFAANINTLASGTYSAAFNNSTATGQASFAANGSSANGSGSSAFGNLCISNGDYSFTNGVSNTANGLQSVAIGKSNVTNGENSAVFGFSSTSESLSEIVIGNFANTISGSASGFVLTDAQFRVGIGTITTRQDAFRVYKNGSFYIMPATQSSITNGIQGSLIFNRVTNALNTHNGTTWSSVTMEPIIDTTTTALSKATLNSTYPNVDIGQKVHAKDILTGGVIYEKTSGTDWLQYLVTTVT